MKKDKEEKQEEEVEEVERTESDEEVVERLIKEIMQNPTVEAQIMRIFREAQEKISGKRCYLCGRNTEEVGEAINTHITEMQQKNYKIERENIDMEDLHTLLMGYHVHPVDVEIPLGFDETAKISIPICIICRCLIQTR